MPKHGEENEGKGRGDCRVGGTFIAAIDMSIDGGPVVVRSSGLTGINAT
jgi:hypothetical protein